VKILGLFFISIIFSSIAALMAFLITYGEYIHHYATKKEPLKLAFEAASFTFVVFFVLSILVAIMLNFESI